MVGHTRIQLWKMSCYDFRCHEKVSRGSWCSCVDHLYKPDIEDDVRKLIKQGDMTYKLHEQFFNENPYGKIYDREKFKEKHQLEQMWSDARKINVKLHKHYRKNKEE